jgi:hypothetical protein
MDNIIKIQTPELTIVDMTVNSWANNATRSFEVSLLSNLGNHSFHIDYMKIYRSDLIYTLIQTLAALYPTINSIQTNEIAMMILEPINEFKKELP